MSDVRESLVNYITKCWIKTGEQNDELCDLLKFIQKEEQLSQATRKRIRELIVRNKRWRAVPD